MSWFKNPWLADKGSNPWAESNPWAQGKTEFQKAVGMTANSDDVQYGPEERDGAIITENGDFKQIQATQDYFFKEQRKENLICSKRRWASSTIIPKQYIKALAKNIKSKEMGDINDANIIFSDAALGYSAAITHALSASIQKATSEDSIPSVLLTFNPISEWKLEIATNPETLNYFSLRSILFHENRHIQQAKILRYKLFAKDKDLTESKSQENRLYFTPTPLEYIFCRNNSENIPYLTFYDIYQPVFIFHYSFLFF